MLSRQIIDALQDFARVAGNDGMATINRCLAEDRDGFTRLNVPPGMPNHPFPSICAARASQDGSQLRLVFARVRNLTSLDQAYDIADVESFLDLPENTLVRDQEEPRKIILCDRDQAAQLIEVTNIVNAQHALAKVATGEALKQRLGL